MDSVLVENATTILGLAVSLTDDFSERNPIGETRVTLGEKRPLKGPSGYCLFLDLKPGAYHLLTQSDYYFEQQADITLPMPSPPVAAVNLKPAPSYPFSERATLVRGMVRQSNGNPVPGAKAVILDRDIEGQTTEKGEFVLYFKKLRESDIIKSGGKRYVRRDGSRKLQLQVTCAGYKKKTVQIEVEECRTTSVAITLTKGG